jgi:hypothetical protein
MRGAAEGGRKITGQQFGDIPERSGLGEQRIGHERLVLRAACRSVRSHRRPSVNSGQTDP